MAIEDLAVNYGLVPDYVDAQPGAALGLKMPQQQPAGNAYALASGPAQQPAASEEEAPAASLSALDARYAGSTYRPELATAARRVNTEQAAFDALVKQALKEPAERPSQAELYFRLAAAFGTPTKTGSFFESLGVVGKEVSDYLKENRATEASSRANRLKTLMESRKISLAAAREELQNLRTLATEEIKARGAQSPAGKQAIDEGLVPGTPAFNRRVTEIAQTGLDAKLAQLNATLVQTQAALQGMTTKQSELGFRGREVDLKEEEAARKKRESEKLTPKEVDLKLQTEDSIASATGAMRALQRAYSLNANSFDTSLPDTVQRRSLELAGSKDPKVVNTRELENLLKDAMISGAADKMKGILSDSDIKLLQSVAGLDSKSKEERGRILRNAYSALKRAQERQSKRLADITAGRYRETTPEAGGE
jgi:hypothetical protein